MNRKAELYPKQFSFNFMNRKENYIQSNFLLISSIPFTRNEQLFCTSGQKALKEKQIEFLSICCGKICAGGLSIMHNCVHLLALRHHNVDYSKLKS